MTRRTISLLPLLLCAGVLTTVFPASAQTFTITDLGPSTVANAINSKGQIVGEDSVGPYLWSNGKRLDFDTAFNPGVAFAINSLGEVAGEDSGDPEPFLYSNGEVTRLPGYPRSINTAGTVVGWFGPKGDPNPEGFAYSKAGVTTNLGAVLGPLGCCWSGAFGINTAGQITGVAAGPGIPQGTGAVIWEPSGKLTVLSTFPGEIDSVGRAINDLGQVTGQANTTSTAHAFLWTKSATVDLDTNGSANSLGLAINNHSVVVGFFALTDTNDHGFAYINGKMRDLNTLIPAHTGWVLNQANGINDAGEIVGDGVLNGENHGFLLKPVPPQISSFTPASGAVGTVVTINGSNFGATRGSSTLSFNGKVVPVEKWSDTEIEVVVPTGATSGKFVVTLATSAPLASNGVTFTVTP
jgi:probable HAF family extracellular repeat protein